jgi:hypothetical protein
MLAAILNVRRFALALTVAAAASLMPAAAFAQDAPDVPPTPGDAPAVERVVQAIHHVTREGVQNIAANTAATLQLIGQLDANGAPNLAIARAAQNGAERTQQIAQNRLAAIRAITLSAASALNDAGAPQPVIRFVLNTGRAGGEITLRAAQASLNAIRTAAQNASANAQRLS